MAKRALLIGSQTYGLTGANPDVHLMAETLTGIGFTCDVRIDDAATRRGIIDGYEQLIRETPEGSEDPVVVYYSGHGGRTPLRGWTDSERLGRRSHLRYLVPSDMDASTETDFRGLLAEELSALQRRLTAMTANVTTILDCCHSGTMSRDPSAFPKSVAREFSIDGALPLLEALDGSDSRAPAMDDSNPDAVRLVACDPLQSAYERDGELGRHGALTEAFVLLLRELGDRPVAWRVVADRLRRTVTSVLPSQRPEVEGPVDRVLFSLTRRSLAGALPVSVRDGVARIDAARLLGVSVGDTYALQADDEAALGTATVTEIVDGRASLDVQLVDGSALPAAAVAVPRRTKSSRTVRIDVSPAVAQLVAARVDTAPQLVAASTDERALATIVQQDGLVVLDPEGFQVQLAPFEANESGAEQAVALALRIAKAEQVRSLRSSDRREPSAPIVVELASHDVAGRLVRARSGERIYVGERISVTITNRSDRDQYVGLLDVDTAYHVRIGNADEPSGWRLPPGSTKVIGGEHGFGVTWDDGVPDDSERPETLLIVASPTPVDFRLLETAKGERGSEPAPKNELEALLHEADVGERGWLLPGDATDSSGFHVEAIDFYLVPGSKPPVGEPAFAITELPSLSIRLVQPRALVAPPARVAVRLVSLKVLKNKALFRAAVRLDALVICGGEQVVATPFTYRFPGIADGDLLPADNLPLFIGPVRDFLDIAIWLNRDDTRGKDLAELFEQKVKDPDSTDALTVLGGLVLAGPETAVAVGAVVGVATVVRVGAQLLDAAVGKEIGLYRTSFLPFEQFGLGRHPAEGRRTAQGIEFAFEVVDPG